MITIQLEGTERLDLKLTNIKTIHTRLRPPMKRATDNIKEKMAKEPGAIPRGHWRANTTPRQRRFFFAALKDGRVSGGRTGNYSRSWQTEITSAADALTGRIHNPTDHGPFVGMKGRQARFLQNRWPADEDVVRDAEPEIRRDFNAAIQTLLDEA